MPTLGRLAIDLVANTSELKAGLEQGRGAIAGFRRTAETASNQLRSWNQIEFSKLRGGLTSLAVAATGVSGPVGQVASVLGSLTLGGGLTAGVVAGIAAIAAGYRLLTKDAREAKEASDKLVESLRKSAETPQQKAFADYQTLNKRAAQLQREIAEEQRGSTVTTEAGDALHFVDFAKIERLQAELAGIHQASLQVGKNLTDALGLKKDAVTGQVRGLRKELEGATAESRNLSVSLGHNLGAMRDLSRMGATAEEQQAMTDAANRGGASDAMRGVGGERGRDTIGFKSAARESAEAANKWQQEWANAARGASSALAGFFSDLIRGGDAGVNALKSLAEQALALLAQLASAGILKGLLGGGIPSAPGLGDIGGELLGIPSFHAGGIVGAGGTMRLVDPAVFLNASRFHRGGRIGADEVPIIAQRGERIIPRGESGSAGGPGPVVNVHQSIALNLNAMDGASAAHFLRSHSATIAGVVAQAASDAPNFAKHIVANGLR